VVILDGAARGAVESGGRQVRVQGFEGGKGGFFLEVSLCYFGHFV